MFNFSCELHNSNEITENGAAVSYSPESTQIVTNTATKNSFAVGGAGAVDPQPQESTGKTGGAVSDSSVVFAGCRGQLFESYYNMPYIGSIYDDSKAIYRCTPHTDHQYGIAKLSA